MGHSLGPVQVGVRFHVPGAAPMTDLGCRGAASYTAISADQPTIRSHPNKAVDVTSNQAWRKDSLTRSTNEFEFRRLRCSHLGHRCERGVAQRLIYLPADPESMQQNCEFSCHCDG